MRSRILQGDCVELLKNIAPRSVDFILTDPPYLVRYRDRTGRSVRNDDRDDWLDPAFAGMYRALKSDAFCVSFYGWNAVDRFMSAWRSAGFSIAGHLVFRKPYASSTRYLRHTHEQAYLLSKGDRPSFFRPIDDVLQWRHTGNRLHPTQKPVSILKPLIGAFTEPGEVVLDPFCGSGSTLFAAHALQRTYLGIELDPQHYRTACERMRRVDAANTSKQPSSLILDSHAVPPPSTPA